MSECSLLYSLRYRQGDVQALEDLTYERRKEFLRQQHLLPQESGGSNRIIPHRGKNHSCDKDAVMQIYRGS